MSDFRIHLRVRFAETDAMGVAHHAAYLPYLETARVEYLRALRYEVKVLPGFDQVQVCTPANRDYLLGFRPELAARMRSGLRAGIDTTRYEFRPRGREPLTMLFLGSFRHDPNRVALDWFVRESLPIILKREPRVRLVVAGSEPPPAHAYADYASNLEMLGYVEEIREPLARYAIFVCPILSGSGVRVKLLEAFEPQPAPVNLMYAAQRQIPLKLRALIDFLVPKLRERLGYANAAGPRPPRPARRRPTSS